MTKAAPGLSAISSSFTSKPPLPLETANMGLFRLPAGPLGASFALLTGADTQAELERQMAGGERATLTHVVDCEERDGLSFRIVDPRGVLPAAS